MPCNCNNRLVFSFGASIALAGCMVAVIYSATFIPPYVYDMNHEAVKCTVLRSFVNGNYCCDATWCGMAACTDIIPCYQIIISYPAPGGASNITAHMFYNYQSVSYQDPNYNCSHYVCPADYAETTREGSAFVALKGKKGDSYTCFRNPTKPYQVLPVMTSVVNLILAVIFSMIATIIGSVVCYFGYKGYFAPCQVEWDDEDDIKELKSGNTDVDNETANGQTLQSDTPTKDGSGTFSTNA